MQNSFVLEYLDTTPTKAWTKGDRSLILGALHISVIRAHPSQWLSKKVKTTLSILGNVFVPGSRPGRALVFFSLTIWLFLKFKAENEITESFPDVKIVLAICQLQVQQLSEVLQRYSTKIFSWFQPQSINIYWMRSYTNVNGRL